MSEAAALAAHRCLNRPLPAGDPSRLRLVAARSDGLAAELRRIAAVLSSCIGSTSWWGAGQRAFTESMAGRAPELRRVADRYQGFADALTDYAGVLDRVQPQLRVLRQDLTAGLAAANTAAAPGPAGGAAIGDGGSRLGAQAQDFEALWVQWQQALGHCVHALNRAAAVDADRSGWSAFGHGVVHVLSGVVDPVVGFVEHPGLAELSRALGSLGDDFAMVGLALLVVCPPAAGFCLTAAAVLSVAKLATDSARAARGDRRVGAGVLGGDLLAALPGGRLVREAGEGARAAKGLDELAEHERTTRLVPGGGLGAHEAGMAGAGKGHTMQKHVGRTKEQLVSRFRTEPKLIESSSFYDRAVAENEISDLLEARSHELNAWLDGGGQTLRLKGVSQESIGVTVQKGTGLVSDVNGIFVYLKRNPSMPTGYHIHTAYPRP